MTSLLHDANIESRYVARFLAELLISSQRPLTELLGRVCDQQLGIEVIDSGERELTEAEQDRLGERTSPSWGHWRTGLLRTQDGIVVAGTWMMWLPSRLPAAVCAELGEGSRPAGLILAPLGMHRADRLAVATPGIEEITGKNSAIKASAALIVDRQRAAITRERITVEFVESLSAPSRH